MDKITGDSVGIANYAPMLSKESKNKLFSLLLWHLLSNLLPPVWEFPGLPELSNPRWFYSEGFIVNTHPSIPRNLYPLERKLFRPWGSRPRILAMFRSHSVCAVQVSTAAVKRRKEAASQENADRESTWDFVVGEDRDEQFGYLEIF